MKKLYEFRDVKDLGGWLFIKGQLRITCPECEVCLVLRDSIGKEIEIRLPVTKRGVINYVFMFETSLDKAYLASKSEDCSTEIVKEPKIKKISLIEKYYRIYRRVLSVFFSRQKITRELRKRVGLNFWEFFLKPYTAYQAVTWRRFYDIWGSSNYEDFLMQFEKFYITNKDRILQNLNKLKYKPKIAVFIPILNEEDFKEASETLKSFKNQIYRNIVPILIKEGDNQIPHSDYYCVVFPGDTLPEYAFYCIANFLNKTGHEPDIIYTDHDIIDHHLLRKEPHFKPDWSKEYFLGYDYIQNLVLFKRELLENIGVFNLSFQYRCVYDAICRTLKEKPEIKISHIPMVLYHQKEKNRNETLRQTNLTYEILQNLFRDTKDIEKIEKGSIDGRFRIVYKMPNPEPLVSIIIPTKDRPELIKKCITSIIQKTSYHNYEIIIIDNGSTDTECLRFYEELKNNEKIKVISYHVKFNFSKLVNLGVSRAKGNLVCLLNNDTEVINGGWLSEMIRYAVREDIGAVGCKLFYPDGKLQHAGVVIGIWNGAAHVHRGLERGNSGYLNVVVMPREVSAVTAACMMVKKSLYEKVGGFDERFIVAFNDVDFCLRLRASGYRNIYIPYAMLYHYESHSRGGDKRLQRISDKDLQYLRKKWKSLYKSDPYYNPNLTFYREDLSFGVPETWLLL